MAERSEVGRIVKAQSNKTIPQSFASQNPAPFTQGSLENAVFIRVLTRKNRLFRDGFGTPERTLTSDLPLRRRPLYTTELPGHVEFSIGIVHIKCDDVNRKPGDMEAHKKFFPSTRFGKILDRHCIYWQEYS